MSFPDYNQLLEMIWGWSDEQPPLFYFSLASNIIVGTNPPFSATDFFSFYPQYGGTPTLASGTTDGITSVITGVSSLTGLAPNQLIAGVGIPSGSMIVAVDETQSTITINNNTTSANSNVQFTVYTNPAVPLTVLNIYIYNATNSILLERYGADWFKCMCYYIAHYLTLWVQSQAAGPGSTPAQLATAGMAMGIRVAKAVHDVSTSYEPLKGLDDFGTYQLTLPGQMLATMAKAVGSGGVLAW